MGRVSGKIALVTGAASGIGRGCAEALAKEGARIIATDIDEKGGAETIDIIKQAGGDARFFKQDVASEQEWIDLYKLIEKDYGALHVIVNNAAICIVMSTFEMTLANWRRQMAIDLDSLFLSTKYGVPLMTKSGGGSIINISSLAGLKGVPMLSGYCAAKAGVRMFTKSMALELAQMRTKIRVNSIHPGAIETSIWLKMPNDGSMPNVDLNRNSDPLYEQRKIAERTTPVGFAGAPSDIAMGVVYLASEEARFVNGIELVIDGGNMAGEIGDIMAEDLKMS